jgi:mono/diheme cytochrome c family protein
MITRTPHPPILSQAVVAIGAVLCLMSPSASAVAQQNTNSPATQPVPPRSEGERVFVDAGCAVCHGLIGHGGVGPALLGDKFLAMGNYVAAQILLGRGEMPGFADRLSNDEIAAVASYIRDSWGNHFGQISAKEVDQQRGKLKSE